MPTRDEVLASGVTINGLPIMLKRPYVGTLDIDELDIYYEDCVIGGPGAFVVPIREREKFIETGPRDCRTATGRTHHSSFVAGASRLLHNR